MKEDPLVQIKGQFGCMHAIFCCLKHEKLMTASNSKTVWPTDEWKKLQFLFCSAKSWPDYPGNKLSYTFVALSQQITSTKRTVKYSVFDFTQNTFPGASTQTPFEIICTISIMQCYVTKVIHVPCHSILFIAGSTIVSFLGCSNYSFTCCAL